MTEHRFRLGAPGPDSPQVEVSTRREGDWLHATITQQSHTSHVTILGDLLAKKADRGLLTLQDGRRFRYEIVVCDREVWVWVSGRSVRFCIEEKSSSRPKRASASPGDAAETLTAPMPGVIRQTPAKPGERANRGQTLMVMESMKMELSIVAPFIGQIETLHVAAGQIVEQGAPLLTLRPATDPDADD